MGGVPPGSTGRTDAWIAATLIETIVYAFVFLSLLASCFPEDGVDLSTSRSVVMSLILYFLFCRFCLCPCSCCNLLLFPDLSCSWQLVHLQSYHVDIQIFNCVWFPWPVNKLRCFHLKLPSIVLVRLLISECISIGYCKEEGVCPRPLCPLRLSPLTDIAWLSKGSAQDTLFCLISFLPSVQFDSQRGMG